ncbi:MAG: helix-turn-helix transcriptional regulator [Candidatus Gastranaerophilales bacterium]|nr:helix-turn-helix transcriptional regulator [Candidatus Gastranaerophilales bacterium]
MSNVCKTKTQINTADKYVTIITKTIGAYVREVREEKGISIRKLATEINVSSTLISDFENGTKIPRMESIIKVIWALDIPINHIFGKKALPSEIFTANSPEAKMSLSQLLTQTGLSLSDVKEVTEFIEFKKSKRNKK